MTVKRKCITVTAEQDTKIQAIQVRRMVAEKRTISYSMVLHQVISEGLEHIQ